MTGFDAERSRQLDVIVNELIIDPGNVQAAFGLNPSAGAPYHGAPHLVSTAVRAYAGGLAEHLSRDERKVLVVAALWHDFDHTAGAGPDAVNIGRAVAGYLKHAGDDQRFVNAVVSAIHATEEGGAGPQNALERVLADADLVQCTEPDGDRWMAGLAAETGLIVNRETTAEFYRGAKLHTAWGAHCVRAAGF